MWQPARDLLDVRGDNFVRLFLVNLVSVGQLQILIQLLNAFDFRWVYGKDFRASGNELRLSDSVLTFLTVALLHD